MACMVLSARNPQIGGLSPSVGLIKCVGFVSFPGVHVQMFSGPEWHLNCNTVYTKLYYCIIIILWCVQK